MSTINAHHTVIVLVTIGLVVLPGLGCRRLSESVERPEAGLNGGFESVEDGLPVNWLVYSPETVPAGDFDLLIDDIERHEGQRSLKFVVRECASDGGWRSPGIAQEIPVDPGATYRISFWIRNDGTDWVVSAGGVGAKTGQLETIEPHAGAAGWQRIERDVVVPTPYDRLRFELSVRSPGTLWIDDVRVEPGGGDYSPSASASNASAEPASVRQRPASSKSRG